MTRVVISQPMYFPWVGFLAQMALADVLIWLDDAQFSRGSFTNRVQVKTVSGQKWMSVPLLGKGNRTAIMDLQAVGRDWPDSHRSLALNSLKSAPHRDHAVTVLEQALATPTLCDAIIASAQTTANACGVSPPRILRSSQMQVQGSGWQRILDLVRHVGGTCYVTGHGARNYLDHGAFEIAGVTVEYMDYAPRPWPQAHGPFTPYVTGLDLVANVAPPQRQAHLKPASIGWRDFLDS